MDKARLHEDMTEMQSTLLRVEEDLRRLRLPGNDPSALRLTLEGDSAFHASIAFVESLECAERLVHGLIWQLDALAQYHKLTHLPPWRAAHERIANEDARVALTTN